MQRPSSGCASRSRTYDGGVKVPCLTAWRWRIMQNSIAYFPLFHKRCAAFLQLFSVRCLPHLRRFESFFGLCGRDLPCFYERQVLRDAFFKKHSPQGAQDSYCKGEIYFFPDFSYYFLKRLYFLLRFWYTGCDKNKLKKLRRCPGCPRAGQCLHLCEGKRGIS